MQTFQITFVVTDDQIAAINHAVIADPAQKENETPGDAWVRRVMADESVPAFVRMQRVADKADKYAAAYAAELAEKGKEYLSAAQKIAAATDA